MTGAYTLQGLEEEEEVVNPEDFMGCPEPALHPPFKRGPSIRARLDVRRRSRRLALGQGIRIDIASMSRPGYRCTAGRELGGSVVSPGLSPPTSLFQRLELEGVYRSGGCPGAERAAMMQLQGGLPAPTPPHQHRMRL